MAFPDYSYDIYEDFEDALGAEWTLVDADNNIDPADAAAKYYGSQGMSVNYIGDTSGVDTSYERLSLGAARSALSLGFWARFASTTDTTYSVQILRWGDDDFSDINVSLWYRIISGVVTLQLRNGGGTWSDNAKSISADTWYWITCHFQKSSGGVSTLRVYNTSETEVDSGTSVTVTSSQDSDRQYLAWGVMGFPDMNESADNYFDDIVVDYTDATFPLLGWETGGGGSVVPIIMQQVRRRRNG